jgi:hypothetical protein
MATGQSQLSLIPRASPVASSRYSGSDLLKSLQPLIRNTAANIPKHNRFIVIISRILIKKIIAHAKLKVNNTPAATRGQHTQ